MITHIKHWKEINLRSFADEADEDANAAIVQFLWGFMSGRLQLAFCEWEKSVDAHPWFAHEWAPDSDGLVSGAPPADPLTIYFNLPLGSNDDEYPVWSLTVTECIDSLIEGRVSLITGKIEPDEQQGAIAIRDALRAAAQRIDDALAKGST